MDQAKQKFVSVFFAHVLAILLIGSTPFAVHAQEGVAFKNHQADITFLESIRFTVELCGLPADAKVYLNTRFSNGNWQYIRAFVDQAASDTCPQGRYTYSLRDYPPFIPIEYYWQVQPAAGEYSQGPHQSIVYEDTRFQWDRLEAGNITVFWHDRPEQFGKQILETAEQADLAQREFFGLDPRNPYRIVIFNTAEEFFGWNVFAGDYIGGEAYPFFDMTVQIVEDESQGWLDEVIPHEISHLYFYQATFRPRQKSYPPAWLDEGVAVYNEFGDHDFEEFLIEVAVHDNSLIPLYQLEDSFGEEPDQVDLSYAEGYSAVSYLIDVYGLDALNLLLKSYRRNLSTEEAFNTAIYKSPVEFEKEWTAWLREKYGKENPVPAEEIFPAATQTPASENPVPAEEMVPLDSQAPLSNVRTVLLLTSCILGSIALLFLVAGGILFAIVIGQTRSKD